MQRFHEGVNFQAIHIPVTLNKSLLKLSKGLVKFSKCSLDIGDPIGIYILSIRKNLESANHTHCPFPVAGPCVGNAGIA